MLLLIVGAVYAVNFRIMSAKRILPVKELQDAFMNDRNKAEKLSVTGAVDYTAINNLIVA
ncbi:hypothetical protein ABIB40_002663 [Pedobacter sp. UYP30]|uniref:hypothetical protein n=1 Tax=Pedobacter sp. UYP30 TaxID=1756400 RepID=UPI003396C9B2